MAFLSAISGSESGKHYELDKSDVILGRHPECDVVIEVGAVSRQHAAIHVAGDVCEIEDLKSRNGTFLNHKKVDSRTRLRDGDVISICDIEFSFRGDEASGINSDLLSGGNAGNQSAGSSFLLVDDLSDSASRGFSSKFDIRGSEYGSQLTSSAESRLQALIEITQSLGKAVKVEEVLPKMLETLFKIFLQADRAFVVLQGANGELVPRWLKTRKEEQEDNFRISRTVIREVMETRQSIISMDAPNDERFNGAVSISDFKIRSIIVAPLIDSDGEPIGAIQMDTLDSKRRFEQGDLEVLASIATQAGVAIENAQLHEQLIEQKGIEQDLELASNIQKALLPQRKPEIAGYQFYDYYHPMAHIGGDYFDYIQLPDGRLVTIVADVAGHGIAAAMLMAKLSAETKFLLASEGTPSVAITKLNQKIWSLGVDKFVTFLCVILDPTSGELEILSAGHMDPIWRKADGSVEEPGQSVKGVPINVAPDFQYESVSMTIQPGDRLVLYTDGITEAMDHVDKVFGIPKMRQMVADSTGDLDAVGDSLVNQIQDYIRGTNQNDDMCFVILERTCSA